MTSRNLILFVLGTAALLGLQMFLSRRYAPQPAPAPISAPSAPAAAPGAAPAPQAAAAQPLPAGPSHELQNGRLKLNWDSATGALKQATWSDGTVFFPPAFQGMGAATGTRFDKVEDLVAAEGTSVVFENAQGERLSWFVPKDGHVLRLDWASPQGHALQLLPLPAEDKQVEHLGRVFSLDDSKLDAVNWRDILHDPFFSFLGAKRKELPSAQARLGLDAGLDLNQRVQASYYFVGLWKLPRTPERGAAGFTLAPEGGALSASLYLGPKEASHLEAFDKAFVKVVDYGFFGAVAKLLFLMLRTIQRVVPDWGWAIVCFTILLRFILWPLNTKQTVSMLRMKDFEPHQKALQEKYKKYGNDMTKKAEMQKELMELYRKNGHNPLGGCLPVLLQMPVFFALWSMLRNVYDLHHAAWHPTWIHDLSSRDPHYIIPVAMGLTMIAQQAVTPNTMGDPAQRKMMMFLMPAMMIFFFAQTPAGLTLYYLVYNLMGLLQTWIVMRSYKPEPIKV